MARRGRSLTVESAGIFRIFIPTCLCFCLDNSVFPLSLRTIITLPQFVHMNQKRLRFRWPLQKIIHQSSGLKHHKMPSIKSLPFSGYFNHFWSNLLQTEKFPSPTNKEDSTFCLKERIQSIVNPVTGLNRTDRLERINETRKRDILSLSWDR